MIANAAAAMIDARAFEPEQQHAQHDAAALGKETPPTPTPTAAAAAKSGGEGLTALMNAAFKGDTEELTRLAGEATGEDIDTAMPGNKV